VAIDVVEFSGLAANESFHDIQKLVGEICQRYDRAYFLRCIDEHRYPVELWGALGEADLLGLGISEEWGGVGGGVLEEAAVVEALGRSGIPAFALIIGQLARMPIVAHGSGDAAHRFVQGTLRGDKRPCFGLTEPDAGTNAFGMRTVAKRVDGGWSVSGQKTYISGADDAEQMLLVARMDNQEGRARFLLLIVDTTAPGLSMTAQRIDVVAPCTQCTVFLDEVFVPDDCVVGEPGRGTGYLFESLNHERIMTSAMACGLGHHVLAKGVEYASVRAPFGKPIGGYQAIQHSLASCKVRLEAARLMCYEAAVAYTEGREAGSLSNMAKWLATEAAVDTVDAVVQCHGGYAFDEEADLMRFLKLLRLLKVAPINNEMVLNFVGEKMLGLPGSY
jgi:alkylation response protein AidB-like acyl-CoA dehydrogenase